MGQAKTGASLFAFFFATIFGMVSPKIMTSTVVITVESQVQCSPKSSMTTTEAIDEVAMFTRLLPMSMAERESSNLSMTFRATLAPFEPFSAADSSLSRLAEEKHISEAEKKAEKQIRTMYAAMYALTSPRPLPRARATPGRRA